MKPIRVITISREYGSGGGAVGQELAKRLGWKLLDRELILEIARRAHVQPSRITEMDEHPMSLIARLLKAFWRGNEYTWSGPPPNIFDSDSLADLSEIVIREAAKLGRCVIVGRGAQCILQGREDTFHVFVYGSRQRKLQRILNRHSSKSECEEALNEIDLSRAAFIRQHYACEWDNRHLYNLLISSDPGIEEATSAILYTAGLGAPKPTPLAISTKVPQRA